MPPVANVSGLSLSEQIRNYGKPNPGEIVTLDEFIAVSTRFLNNGTALPANHSFFNAGGATLDGLWNNFTFPILEQAADIVGISFNTNLELAGAAPLGAKADRVFWSTARLTIQYRQRANRISIPVIDLMDRSIVYASGATPAASWRSASHRNDGYYYLLEPLAVGAQQNVNVGINYLAGFTSLAYGAASSAVIPNQSLTNDSGAFFQVKFKLRLKGESQQ